jgi:hypothetical protein
MAAELYICTTLVSDIYALLSDSHLSHDRPSSKRRSRESVPVHFAIIKNVQRVRAAGR